MSTYGGGVKVIGAIAASGNAASTFTTTVYTVPSNCYALVNMTLGALANTAVAIGGQPISFGSVATLFGVVAGPGQAIQVTGVGGSSGTLSVCGVVFSN